jgi:hypothetical protein
MLKEVRKASASLVDLENLRTMAKEREAYETRLGQVEDPLVPLREKAEWLTEFRRRGVPVDQARFSAKALGMAKTARTIKEAFHADPASIIASDERLRYSFWDQMKKNGPLYQDLSKALDEAWKGYANSLRPSLNVEALTILSGIPGLRQKVQQIRHFLTQFEQLGATLPQKTSALDELQQLADTVRQGMKEIRADDMPDYVTEFFQLASQQGCPWSKMTPPLVQWLEANQILGDLRVVIKGAGSTKR